MTLVDKIYRPCDNLTLSVILKNDGTRDCRVLGALTEAVKAQAPDAAALDAGQWERTKEIFRQASLQLVSFTITEKGYALYKGDGSYFDFVRADLENGPERAKSAMAVVAAMLLARYQAGGGAAGPGVHGQLLEEWGELEKFRPHRWERSGESAGTWTRASWPTSATRTGWPFPGP